MWARKKSISNKTDLKEFNETSLNRNDYNWNKILNILSSVLHIDEERITELEDIAE